MKFTTILTAAALSTLATTASAATYTLDLSDTPEQELSENGQSFTMIEPWLGFDAFGGIGTGQVVKQSDFDNSGRFGTIRQGRVDGSDCRQGCLDSNDLVSSYLYFRAPFGEAITSVSATLDDAADEGSEVTVSWRGSVLDTLVDMPHGNSQQYNVDVAMNNIGKLRAFGTSGNDHHSWREVSMETVNTIPLPGAAWALIVGLGGLGFARRFN